MARIVQGMSPLIDLDWQAGFWCSMLILGCVSDMQRFQVPYNLKEIGEVQAYLNQAFENAKHHGDLQDLYRRR